MRTCVGGILVANTLNMHSCNSIGQYGHSHHVSHQIFYIFINLVLVQHVANLMDSDENPSRPQQGHM